MSAPTAVEDALLRREVHLRKAAARLAKAVQERKTMFACRKGAQKERVARYFDRMTAAGIGVDLTRPATPWWRLGGWRVTYKWDKLVVNRRPSPYWKNHAT